jgi:uncharacterized protein (DUF58 family)
MLTARGFWFLLIVFTLLVLALLSRQVALVLVGLALLFWFLAEWLAFAVRCHVVARRLGARRTLHDGEATLAALWAGRAFEVRVALRLDGPVGLPCVAAADRVPFGVEQVGGTSLYDGALAPGEPVLLTYTLRCPAAGQLRFDGLRLELADLQGFFYRATFLPVVGVYRVLPALTDAAGHTPTVKRHNLLPPPGVHRLRRPGSGSELLDLRDYMPGDPPKTIAWKVSARRDRLITKEFESEVPVRCTLFVDTSNSVRLGPAGHNALSGLVAIAAAAAQANSGSRDLTGLCLFDEAAAQVVRPARGARHLAGLLNRLTDAARLAPTTARAPVAELMPLAYALAQEVYPDLMSASLNRVPAWLPWLWPVPADSGRRPGLAGSLYRGSFVGCSALLMAFGLLVFYLLMDLLQEVLPLRALPVHLSALAGVVFAVLVLRRVYPALPLAFASHRRRAASWRKQLAALLALRQQEGPGGLALFLEDDERFSLALQRFLAEHQVPYPLPLYDAHGRYLFASPGKVDVLARALLQAVGKGHDNELFVLLVDLLELGDRLEPLLRAVRVALGRHHQVVVICPWPYPRHGVRGRSPQTLLGQLEQVTAGRLEQAYAQLRRTFARMGVAVIRAAGDEPVQLILDRVERLRGLGRRR